MPWKDDYGRVQAMTIPSMTWDLSPNDIKALESVLRAILLLVDEIASRDGQTSSEVFNRIAAECDKFTEDCAKVAEESGWDDDDDQS